MKGLVQSQTIGLYLRCCYHGIDRKPQYVLVVTIVYKKIVCSVEASIRDAYVKLMLKMFVGVNIFFIHSGMLTLPFSKFG